MKTQFTVKIVYNVNSNYLGRGYWEIKNDALQTLKYLKIIIYGLHFILHCMLYLFILKWDLSTIHRDIQSFNVKIKLNPI